jgi:hypothetical protein
MIIHEEGEEGHRSLDCINMSHACRHSSRGA